MISIDCSCFALSMQTDMVDICCRPDRPGFVVRPSSSLVLRRRGWEAIDAVPIAVLACSQILDFGQIRRSRDIRNSCAKSAWKCHSELRLATPCRYNSLSSKSIRGDPSRNDSGRVRPFLPGGQVGPSADEIPPSTKPATWKLRRYGLKHLRSRCRNANS